MKKLQRNFTTKEQSKRLLKLGVPKNSADLYYNKFGALEAIPEYRNFNEFCDSTDTPCWSVGRLMEIIDECALGEENPNPNAGEYPSTKKVKNKLCISYIEYLVKSIARAKLLGTIDFSKLEE